MLIIISMIFYDILDSIKCELEILVKTLISEHAVN